MQYTCPSGQLTQGLRHLAALRKAGLTHIHLLPSYDFGSVPERRQDQQKVQVRNHSTINMSYNKMINIYGGIMKWNKR